MRKTGNKLRSISIIIFTVWLGLSVSLKAQDVDVKATLSETNIFVGEGVTLQIEVTGSQFGSFDRPNLPDISGLRWLPNRTSQSTNYTYANNRTSVVISYGFQLIAQDVGSYKIPPITVEIGGKTYNTKSIPFKVLDPKTIDSKKADSSPDIYVRIEPSITNPVIGQQVIASVVLYFKAGIEVNSYQALSGWKAEGFWKEELEMQRQARSSSSIINGVRYQRAELLNYALFPTKAGELILSPFPISVRMRQNRGGFKDPFSFGFGQENKELKTLPVTLTVQKLPEAKNGDLIGAVGNFRITRNISTAKAFVGESVEIETKITGTGNVPLLNKPEYTFPDALEEYNPQENTQINRANNIISGTKVFTDIIIARNEGDFIIPEKNIAVYDPNRKNFKYTTLPALHFEATPDPKATAGAQLIETRLNIKPKTGLAQWSLTATNYLLHDRTLFIWLALPFIFLLGAFGYKQYSDKMTNDTGFSRSQKARQKSFETLDEASATTDIKLGYHLIQAALSQFIADKCNLPEAGISNVRLLQEIKTKAPAADVSELQILFNKCETIAYAPNVSQEGLDGDIEIAKELIKKLGKLL